ncbi:MAG: hypothetical protein NTV23_10435 [Propionibacteriales bacterium]|nr:hypothetical protein [Propionibacteriales bacterium]
MTEPSKHRRAEPRRAARPARNPGRVLAWMRTTPGLAVAAVVLVVLAVGVQLLTRGAEESPGSSTLPGAVNATFGDRWMTVDGFSYEVAIETLDDLVQGSSDGGSGCLAAPPAGMTNLRFRIVVTNRSDRAAPLPRLDFGTDLGRGGKLQQKTPSFAQANKAVVVTPLVAGVSTCADASRLGTTGRPRIPAGGAVEYFGAFGPLDLPLTSRPTVLYRYYAADNGADRPRVLLAPYGNLPTS